MLCELAQRGAPAGPKKWRDKPGRGGVTACPSGLDGTALFSYFNYVSQSCSKLAYRVDGTITYYNTRRLYRANQHVANRVQYAHGACRSVQNSAQMALEKRVPAVVRSQPRWM